MNKNVRELGVVAGVSIGAGALVEMFCSNYWDLCGTEGVIRTVYADTLLTTGAVALFGTIEPSRSRRWLIGMGTSMGVTGLSLLSSYVKLQYGMGN